MPRVTRVNVLVLVNATPVLTAALDETMCVAGARVDGDRPEWIRLHPVPFRDLTDESRFAKYQELEVDVARPKSDRRPESWSPRDGTIRLGARLDTANGWADRRAIVEQLYETTMCHLVRANAAGSGPSVPSLAVVRPASAPDLVIEQTRGRAARQVAPAGWGGQEPPEPRRRSDDSQARLRGGALAVQLPLLVHRSPIWA